VQKAKSDELDLLQLRQQWQLEYEHERLSSNQDRNSHLANVQLENTHSVADDEAQRQIKEMRVLLDRLYADKERLTLQCIRQEKTQQDLK